MFAAPPPPAAVKDTCSVEVTEVLDTNKKQAGSKRLSGPVTPCLLPARRVVPNEGAARLEREQQRGVQHMLDSQALTAAVRAPERSAAERLAAVRERVLARLAPQDLIAGVSHG